MVLLRNGAISRTLTLLIGCSVLLPAALTLGLLLWQQDRLEHMVADILVTREMESLLHGYYNLCKSHTADEQSLVKEILASKRLGESGYVALLRGKGPNRGTYLLSKDGKRDGENVWNTQDASGVYTVRGEVARGLSTPPGRISRSDPFYWKNPGEAKARRKVVYITYYEPWDWIISVGVYDEERDNVLDRVHKAFGRLFAFVLAGGAAMSLLALAVGVRVSRGMTRPLAKVVAAAQAVAEGDLASAQTRIDDACALVDPRLADWCRDPVLAQGMGRARDSETGQLILAIGGMVHRLRSLIGQVQGSSVQLLSTATEIAATAKHQEAALNDLGTSSNEIAASVNEISATSRELVGTMDRVTATAGETARLAGSGRSAMAEMEDNIRGLCAASDSVSQKLATIDEKARNINAVMATITKVTGQTNLLSLNAAIEAEKAGEHGLGFGVVAREIRRLADLTAVAAVDIERMIKEMQSSVGSGVVEMAKFSQAMDRGREQMAGIGSEMGQIIARVEELTPQFQAVRDGMMSQSQGAQQISEAMMTLTAGTRGTLESLREFNKATEHMHAAMRGLKDEMGKFRA